MVRTIRQVVNNVMNSTCHFLPSLTVLVFSGVMVGVVMADPVIVHLKSGGTIEGEIVSRINGLVTIESKTGGRITIQEALIKDIDQVSGDHATATPTPTHDRPVFQILEKSPTPTPAPTMEPKRYTIWLTDGQIMQNRLVTNITSDAFILDSNIAVPKGVISRYRAQGGELVVLRPFLTQSESGGEGDAAHADTGNGPVTHPASVGGEPSTPRTQQQVIGKVVSTVGKVGRMEGENTVRIVKAGENVHAGDRLVTAEGRAKIQFTNDTDFRVRENSTVQVQDTDSVSLQQGKIWAKVKSVGGHTCQLQVTTPNSIAGVRGTLLSVEVESTERVRVAVLEGVVNVQWLVRSNISEQLAGGNSVTIGKTGISPVSPVTPDDIREWQFWDQWQADVEKLAQGFLVGGQIIQALGQQIAAEQKLYESMTHETNELIRVQKTQDDMVVIWNAISRFRHDTGQWPPLNDPWTPLFMPTGAAGWSGPYIVPGTNNKWRSSPFKDHWRQMYVLEVLSDTKARLISNGPNKRFENGSGDDLVYPKD